MALWTDKTKFLHVGRSGLQYRTSFTCSLSPDTAERLITDFYQARHAALSSKGDGHTLTFTRGREWMSRYATLLILSERWLRQTITITLTPQPSSVVVDIGYDVRLCYTIVIGPNQIAKEADELRSLMEAQ